MWRSGGVDRAWASPSVIEVPAGALAGVASTSIASTIPLARLSLARRKRGVGGAREAESWPTPARGDTWKYDLYKACVTDVVGCQALHLRFCTYAYRLRGDTHSGVTFAPTRPHLGRRSNSRSAQHLAFTRRRPREQSQCAGHRLRGQRAMAPRGPRSAPARTGVGARCSPTAEVGAAVGRRHRPSVGAAV